MENTNVNVNEQEQSSEQVEQVAEQTVKTFTQEEVDKIVNKRLARERKDIEAKIEAERQKAMFEKQVAEFEATKRAFEQEKLLNETSKQVASKN